MNRNRYRAPLRALLLLALPVVLAASGQYQVKIETGMKAKMRDGVSLVADIYRPVAKGEFPVLVERTPYNRKGGARQAREIASYGYIVVVQDTRGRYESEGEFYPFRNETNDGYDTIEWAAALPGSTGKVGMYGGSYVGATQMLATIGKPPHLVAIFPYVTAAEYYDGWTYQSGALMQWFAESWTTGLVQDTLRRTVSSTTRPKDWAWRLPVDEYRLLKLPRPADLAPYFRDWVAHETDDPYWKRWRISSHYSELDLRALHGGGWHDIFLKGTLTNYMGLHVKARTQQAREAQRLLIGPWAHARTSPEGKVGDVTFGKQAVLDMAQTIRAWSDYSLKGVRNQYATGAPVRLFIMGENVWRDEQEFPLKRQRLRRYYLHSAGGANSVRGEGPCQRSKPSGRSPTDSCMTRPTPCPQSGADYAAPTTPSRPDRLIKARMNRVPMCLSIPLCH